MTCRCERCGRPVDCGDSVCAICECDSDSTELSSQEDISEKYNMKQHITL